MVALLSVGAVHQNPCMWFLHVAWDSHSAVASSKKECPRSEYSKRPTYVAFYNVALEIPESHFWCFLLVKQVAKANSHSEGGGDELDSSLAFRPFYLVWLLSPWSSASFPGCCVSSWTALLFLLGVALPTGHYYLPPVILDFNKFWWPGVPNILKKRMPVIPFLVIIFMLVVFK